MLSSRFDRETTEKVVIASGCIALWVSLSAGLILFNKYILTIFGFPYPISLALLHMAFCSIVSFLLVRVFKFFPSQDLDFDVYARSILPIAVLYASALGFGNMAYLHLSVAFIQMLKSLMPVTVFTIGSLFGNEMYSHSMLGSLMVVTVGVAIASYGEVYFSWFGFALQVSSILSEATRLTLVQVLLQKQGLRLNPITTLYYLAPACFLILTVPFVLLEMEDLADDNHVHVDWAVFGASAFAALALNLSIFLLIGKTSALTMNVCGVFKDWLLIFLSTVLFQHRVSMLSLQGYGLALGGVFGYNHLKLKRMNDMNSAALISPKKGEIADNVPLVTKSPLEESTLIDRKPVSP